MQCAGRIAMTSALGVMLLHAASAGTPPDAPLTAVGAREGSPQTWPRMVDRGSFVFSQYNRARKTYEVVALNLHDQASTTLVSGIENARFLARDDRRAVIADPKPPATRLRVFDIASGSSLASINLADGASWARIGGGQLMLIQNFDYSYQASTKATVLDLATLKPLKSADLGLTYVADTWGDQVVIVGKDVRIYDASWGLTGTIALPSVPPDKSSVCQPFQVLVFEDKAVTNVGCSHLAVLDLRSRKVSQVIDVQRGPFHFAVAQGLVYTVPSNSRSATTRASVFDLSTGKRLLTLPIAGDSVVADGDRLLAISPGYPQKPLITFYSVDAAAMRSGQWRDARVREECTAAATSFAIERDVYAAADRCEQAGIELLARDRWHEPEYAPVMRNYGLWLAAGFDRYAEAIPILEALKPANDDDAEIAAQLAGARLKVRLLGGNSDGELTASDRKTPLGAVYSKDDERLKSHGVIVDDSLVAGGLLFDGERVYAASTQSDTPQLEVFDRKTLRRIKSVDIPATGNAEDETGISSIAIHQDQIWVSISRLSESGEPNLFVLDPKTFAILRRGTLSLEGHALFSRSGLLLACDCAYGKCDAVDPTTLTQSVTEGWYCNSHPDLRLQVTHVTDASNPRFPDATTTNYFVTRDADGSEGQFFTVQSRGKAAAPPLLDKHVHRRFNWLEAVQGTDRVLVWRSEEGTVSLNIYDIPTGKARTLYRFASGVNNSFAMASDGRYAYLSLGRDLVIYDLVADELKHYVRDFILFGYDPDHRGSDSNQVSRLIVDRQNLIVVTRDGQESRILDLDQLDAKPASASGQAKPH